MRIILDVKPTMKVGTTNKQVYDQGITYNQAGLTYNEVGYAYGGIYGNDVVPIVNWTSNAIPRVVAFGEIGGTQIQHGTIILGRGMLIGMLGMTYPVDGTIIF